MIFGAHSRSQADPGGRERAPYVWRDASRGPRPYFPFEFGLAGPLFFYAILPVMKKLWPIWLAAVTLVADRFLKELVQLGFHWSFGPAQITQFRNDGLIFSLPAPYWLTVALMVLAGIFIAIIAWRQRQLLTHLGPLWLIGVGALSNLYDRLVYGHIVDYIFLSSRLPIVNLADVALAIGVVWFLWRPAVKKIPTASSASDRLS